MGKLFGAIIGAILGYIGGLVIGFFCEIVSCFMGGSTDGYVVAFICAIICAGLGILIGHSSDKEKAEKMQRDRLAAEERNRQYLLAQQVQEQKEAEARFKNWCSNLDTELEKIEESSRDDLSPKEAYNKIWDFEKTINTQFKSYYEKAMSKHRNELCKMITDNLTRNRGSIKTALYKLSLLKASYKNDSKFDSALKALNMFYKYIEDPQPKYISFGEYGNIILPLDDKNEMDYMIANADNMLEKLQMDMECFTDNKSGCFEGIVQYMTKDFIYNVARLTWFYAKHKPFNVDAFEEVRFILNKYTNIGYAYSKDKHAYPLESAEEILAVIYSKNQLGGKNTAQQERENIKNWIEHYSNNEENCARLASGLAWMELYDLERDVLRNMVQNKISMTPELQERLTLLESGNNMNIKVYTVDDTDDFMYDSSAASWTANDMEVFFRKLGMKRLTLDYSLAVSEWKQTLPLINGQKFSSEELYCEFQEMVQDFDGEISCGKTNARAIDLANVEYPNAVLFRFNSERNRCLSMLFSSEKFGRNLNITIITLFTPETDMEIESMQKYATAIKSNIYVESFREVILQAIDKVIKEEKKIYDDEDSSSSGGFFE